LKFLYITLSDDDNVYEKSVDTFYPDKWVTGSDIFSSSIQPAFWGVASLSITDIPIFSLSLSLLGGIVDEVLLKQQFGYFCRNTTFVLLLSLYVLVGWYSLSCLPDRFLQLSMSYIGPRSSHMYNSPSDADPVIVFTATQDLMRIKALETQYNIRLEGVRKSLRGEANVERACKC